MIHSPCVGHEIAGQLKSHFKCAKSIDPHKDPTLSTLIAHTKLPNRPYYIHPRPPHPAAWRVAVSQSSAGTQHASYDSPQAPNSRAINALSFLLRDPHSRCPKRTLGSMMKARPCSCSICRSLNCTVLLMPHRGRHKVVAGISVPARYTACPATTFRSQWRSHNSILSPHRLASSIPPPDGVF